MTFSKGAWVLGAIRKPIPGCSSRSADRNSALVPVVRYGSAKGNSYPSLTIMLIIAAVGMPFVLAYSGIIYWTFRGKVELGDHSY
jgi:hypothetical protein